MDTNKKVFLGGTCNNSDWRNELIPQLNVEFFNPLLPADVEWTNAHYEEELKQREECGKCLYVLTPKMTGHYSVAELVDDSNKRPDKTVFCFVEEDGENKFDKHQIKSMTAIGKMVEKNGGKWLNNLSEVAEYLNKE